MKKIAYIVDGMYNSAGMERVITTKANALCQWFDITIITRDQQGRQPFFPLDARIRMVDVGARDKHTYRMKLEPLLKQEHFDICISTGGLEFYFLYAIHDGSRKIFEFHFSYDISRVWMGPQMHGIKLWLFSNLQKWRRIRIARHYDYMVVLCKADYQKWRRWCPQVSYIYNPLTIAPTANSPCTSPCAIAVGRLDYQKGFDMLIRVWERAHQAHADWQLRIYGEGDQHEALQRQIDQAGLYDVVTLCGRTEDITKAYNSGSIFVLSSRDEAFGLVITEAEACGLPIVTFDCPSAPAELVKDSTNGFIVPLGDEEAMADCICRLIEDASLRKEFGKASVAFAKQFHVDNIAKQWKELFEETLRYE